MTDIVPRESLAQTSPDRVAIRERRYPIGKKLQAEFGGFVKFSGRPENAVLPARRSVKRLRLRLPKGAIIIYHARIGMSAMGESELLSKNEKQKGPSRRKPESAKTKPRSLAKRLARVNGKAPGLPADASVNHDHYLYGAPKQL